MALKFTDYLAIYAAILSSLVFVWNIVNSRPRIRVEMVVGSNGDGDQIQFGVYVSIKNVSAHAVHLSNVSLLYPYEKSGIGKKLGHLIRFRTLPRTVGWVHTSLSNYKIKDGCPLSIDARKSHGIFIPNAVLKEVFTDAVRHELKAVVQDQLWQNTYSGIFKVNWDVDE